jgi:hypothetical protein
MLKNVSVTLNRDHCILWTFIVYISSVVGARGDIYVLLYEECREQNVVKRRLLNFRYYATSVSFWSSVNVIYFGAVKQFIIYSFSTRRFPAIKLY